MNNNLYNWQQDAVKKLNGKNGILSAPTGAGKTKVCFEWVDLDGDSERIIFTAPIKALSNERYLELKDMGYDVGIETGDFKENTSAKIICCTQEIYTLKYADKPNQKVVVDEFHYVANNSDRARAYIDGIKNTNKDSQMLLVSATFGDMNNLKEYIEDVTDREFESYETKERMTELVFKDNETDYEDINNALVFSFSVNNCNQIVHTIASTRDNIKSHNVVKINNLVKELKVDGSKFPGIYRGIGVYYGSMLPKEKLLMEKLYKEGFVDTMVGTDALALGVNLPAENVIFSQLGKYYSGPISAAEFHQMAGRAGRKGYYDTGYVSVLNDYNYESLDIEDTMEQFKYLQSAPIEDFKVNLTLDYKKILNSMGKTLDNDILRYINDVDTLDINTNQTIQEELNYVSNYSIPKVSESYLKDEIEYLSYDIKGLYCEYGSELGSKIVDIAKETYFSEYDVDMNFRFAKALTSEKEKISVTDLLDIDYEDSYNFSRILQFKRFLNQLPKHYKSKIKDMHTIDNAINSIDETFNNLEKSRVVADESIKKVSVLNGDFKVPEFVDDMFNDYPVYDYEDDYDYDYEDNYEYEDDYDYEDDYEIDDDFNEFYNGEPLDSRFEFDNNEMENEEADKYREYEVAYDLDM